MSARDGKLGRCEMSGCTLDDRSPLVVHKTGSCPNQPPGTTCPTCKGPNTGCHLCDGRKRGPSLAEYEAAANGRSAS